MRTSYSAIETYLQCPQKYKFQVIDKIRKPKSREAIFGTLIHSTLKFMFQKDPLFPTLDEVIAYFREHWPSHEVFEQESKNDPLKRGWTEEEQKIYFEEGVRMLKKFYEKNAPWNFSVVDLESRFEVVIADEKTGETHILAGIIDRIDKLADGSYEIIDYKTGKKMPPQDAVDANLQLSLYSLGLQKRWPHITADMIKLSLYFLKHGEKLSTKSTAETTEKTKAHVLGTISEIQERIAEKKEFEPMPSPLCNWCAYKPICPAWKHLYRTKHDTHNTTREEIQKIIKEYFEIKKRDAGDGKRLKELQDEIKEYMAQEGVTRVFGDEGMISKKKGERYEYDFEKIKTLLSPLGKWEETLKPDEMKLRKIMPQIPEDVRSEIEAARSIKSEYITLTASAKKISGAEPEKEMESLDVSGSGNAPTEK